MTKILILFLSLISLSSFASYEKTECRFTAYSGTTPGSLSIDKESEKILLEEGMHITEDPHAADFNTQIRYTHKLKYAFGGFISMKSLNLKVQKNSDKSVVFEKTIYGEPNEKNKRILLERLEHLPFDCEKED